MNEFQPTTSTQSLSTGFRRLALTFTLALTGFTAACATETSDEAGGDGDLATGPTMLPGDNCRSCHGGPSSQYPEAPDWSVAGTVFESADSDVGAEGVNVLIRDISGKTVELTTNSVGNFYTSSSLEFPYWVSLEKDGVVVDMPAPPPSGGCNACHSNPAIGSAPGKLFVPENGTYASVAACDEDGETLVAGITRYPCTPFVCIDASGGDAAYCLTSCASDEDCARGACDAGVCVE